jgi:hypothetical protein
LLKREIAVDRYECVKLPGYSSEQAAIANASPTKVVDSENVMAFYVVSQPTIDALVEQ